MNEAQTSMRSMAVSKALLIAASLSVITGCAVGPDYHPPAVAPAPAAFKGTSGASTGVWQQAVPGDVISRGDWWKRFGDSQLDSLEAKVEVSSATIQQADAQFRQARALIRQDRAAYFPTVTTSPSITEQQVSTNRSNQFVSSKRVTQFSLPVDASYEADVWGRIRRTVEGGRAEAQASAADLENVRLSVHTEVAADYLDLRALDAERALLQSSLEAFERALQLTTNRYNAGVASRGDVAQAQTQLESTRAQLEDIGVQRAQVEDAIAVLIGQLPSNFSLADAPLANEPPAIPVNLPSELVQRRPDVAAAERRVAGANARVGVATAAFFPSVLLSASAGFQSSRFTDWLAWPSRFWSVGPSLALTLFDGGARRAVKEEAIAGYDATVASYRQSVLTAFQDVEDNLAALRILSDEARTQQAAVEAARQSTEIALNQYRTGIVSYLQVVTAQSAALANQRAALEVLARRYMASVQLVKALGGGWDASQLPQDLK